MSKIVIVVLNLIIGLLLLWAMYQLFWFKLMKPLIGNLRKHKQAEVEYGRELKDIEKIGEE